MAKSGIIRSSMSIKLKRQNAVYSPNRTNTIATVVILSLLLGSAAAMADDQQLPLHPAAFNWTGTYALRQTDPELTGKGVTIATVCRSLTYIDSQPQNDYLLNVTHDCLSAGNISYIDEIADIEGISPHATAIGGILAGSAIDGFHPDIGEFIYEGAAPQADIEVYEFWRFVSGYVYGEKEFDADILTMSVGVVFDTWWTRGIDRMADRNGLIVVAGIGNGSDVSDPVLYPAVGPNIIGVGVIDSIITDDTIESLNTFTLPHPNHSSSGPGPDGRCGPDLVAPGNCLVPAASNVEDYEMTGDWSSFATPVVSGSIAMLVQTANENPALNLAISEQGGNCVIKSILMTSAIKLPYWHKGLSTTQDDHHVSLDYLQGAGLFNALAAHDILTAGRSEPNIIAPIGWDNNTIEKYPDAMKVYTFDTSNIKDDHITATLVWNRHFKNKYPFKPAPKKDSDLRLELWAVDETEPNNSYLLDYSDTANDNIEHIHAAMDPDFTTYDLVVMSGQLSAADKPEQTENYALSWRTTTPDTSLDHLWYDLNSDGKVGIEDILLIMNNIDNSPDSGDGYITGDLNMDGVINADDAVKLLKNLTQPQS